MPHVQILMETLAVLATLATQEMETCALTLTNVQQTPTTVIQMLNVLILLEVFPALVIQVTLAMEQYAMI